jgi:hypothetical protein
MNYEYLTFDYDAVDAPVDPYADMTYNQLIDAMVEAAHDVSPYYAIGWLTGTIKTLNWRGPYTRKQIIDDIEYLKAVKKRFTTFDESVINF